MHTKKKYSCIYCRKVKPKAEFDKEHVLNDAFGRYNNALTLINKVCKECNEKFGKTIDNELARGTLEGFQRFERGIKNPEGFCMSKYSKNSRLVCREGLFKGVECELKFDLHDKQFKAHPIKDMITLKKEDGSYVQPLPLEYCNEILPANQLIEFDRTYTITKGMFRAIAKIAFNYLAYHNKPEVVLQECFNPIRNFIVEGVGSQSNYIVIDTQPILPEENNRAPSIHIIALRSSPKNGPIVISVSLFNSLCYHVLLTQQYNGDAISTGFGHYFDPHNGKIGKIWESSIIRPTTVTELTSRC